MMRRKLVYDEILYAIVHRKEEVQIATTDVEQMELAYLAVRYDYCDLFWLKQFFLCDIQQGR